MIEKDIIFFDRLGDEYETNFLNLKHVGARLVYQEFMNMIISNLESNVNSKILDIGCGTGFFLRFLNYKKYRYLYGLDISSKLIKFAKKKSDSINYTIGSALQLPFKKKFQTVVLYDLLHHISNIDNCIKNIHEVLFPNGLLIIFDPNKRNFIGEIIRMFLKKLNLLSSTEKAININEIKNKLQNNGFSIMRLNFFNIFSFPLSGVIIRFSPLPNSRTLFKKIISLDKKLINSFISEFLGWKILLVAKKL
jgi:2-polyprenyl-3-methyl-5-hydroxy-6-metoxy-1,4-benzoquinol methylase